MSASIRLWDWKTYPICLRTDSSAAAEAARSSWPSTRSDPSCAERSAPTSVSSVVFPEPDGPVTITISPAPISVVMSNRICLRSSPVP